MNSNQNSDDGTDIVTADDLNVGDRVTIAYDSARSETLVEKTGEVVKTWATGYELVADEDDENRRIKVVHSDRLLDGKGRARVTSKLRRPEVSIQGDEWTHGTELGRLERSSVEGDDEPEEVDTGVFEEVADTEEFVENLNEDRAEGGQFSYEDVYMSGGLDDVPGKTTLFRARPFEDSSLCKVELVAEPSFLTEEDIHPDENRLICVFLWVRVTTPYDGDGDADLRTHGFLHYSPERTPEETVEEAISLAAEYGDSYEDALYAAADESNEDRLRARPEEWVEALQDYANDDEDAEIVADGGVIVGPLRPPRGATDDDVRLAVEVAEGERLAAASERARELDREQRNDHARTPLGGGL